MSMVKENVRPGSEWVSSHLMMSMFMRTGQSLCERTKMGKRRGKMETIFSREISTAG